MKCFNGTPTKVERIQNQIPLLKKSGFIEKLGSQMRATLRFWKLRQMIASATLLIALFLTYTTSAYGAAIAASYPGHSLLLRDDGTVWEWGERNDGLSDNHARPVQVLTGVQAIATGGFHSLALKMDGTLWAWGNNNSGQIGDGTTLSRVGPVQVLSGVWTIAGGIDHSMAIKLDGTLWAWGGNGYGQLGDGGTVQRTTPAQVPA